MKYEVLNMQVEGSVGNPTLTTYIIDSSKEFIHNERPLVLICPGGGYEMVSDREGELLALQFSAMGYHTAILRYSVAPAVYPTQLLEVAKAITTIRNHAKEWNVLSDKIILQGSSAGGHLAASFCCFYKEDFLAEKTGVKSKELKPNGLMLDYPVITSGEYAHRGSFVNLLGDRYDELLEKVSLEKQVHADMPPAFVWHTYTDDCVPVENSLLFVSAYRKYNIPMEFHMFPKGGHGLSLANRLTVSPYGEPIMPEVGAWVAMAGRWLEQFNV